MEDGFGLVVRVVGKEDGIEPMLDEEFAKQLVAEGAIKGRSVAWPAAEQRLDLLACGEGVRQSPGEGELADKLGVGGALGAARLVIEVDEVQVQVGAVMDEQVEHGDAVSAA